MGCAQPEDTALLRFLEARYGKGRMEGPDYFYDPKYALRLCLEQKQMRACVYIYGMMGMHEEAVALALQVRRCLHTLSLRLWCMCLPIMFQF